MKLKNLIEMAGRISPPDIDVEWRPLKNGMYGGMLRTPSGDVASVRWDPKDPDMLHWKTRDGDSGYDQIWEVIDMLQGDDTSAYLPSADY